MTDAMKRRIFAVVALAIAGAALAFISFGSMGESIVYYLSPTELIDKNARDATVRLGGMVVADSIDWDQERHTTSFTITDMENTIDIVSSGNPPQMFRENIGVVVEGKWGADGVFRTDRIMVKHDNEYNAPEEGGAPNPYENTLADES